MATLQVRDVSDETVETLKERAKAVGLSLSAYIRGLLDDVASHPTVEDVLVMVARQEPVLISDEETVAVIQEGRR